MSDKLSISGSIATQGASGVLSGDPQVAAAIAETMNLAQKDNPSFVLASDAELIVDLASLGFAAGVNVVMVKIVGGAVTLGMTSPAGADQKVTVDSFALIISRGKAFTGISLTRDPGVPVTVKLFLGQKA